jgi:hypothetical protein
MPFARNSRRGLVEVESVRRLPAPPPQLLLLRSVCRAAPVDRQSSVCVVAVRDTAKGDSCSLSTRRFFMVKQRPSISHVAECAAAKSAGAVGGG